MRWLVVIAAGLTFGCSSSSGSTFRGGPTDDAGAGGLVPDGASLVGDGGDVDATGCSEAAKLVYVVSAENDLYSFQPALLMFKRIGTLGCSAGAATPNSMAVGRDGTAWVNYSDGRLFKVSTTDASCTGTPFAVRQAGFGNRFGMGFSSNQAGSKDETLYIADVESGRGLAAIDLTTFAVKPVGSFGAGLTVGGELTGSGDGRLWGFFTTRPQATFARIDKTSGATSDVLPLAGVSTGTHWAFSFWGGDFWFYTADTSTNPSATSSVTRMDTQNGNALKVVRANVGFRIVGAGVSTCAPTSIPR